MRLRQLFENPKSRLAIDVAEGMFGLSAKEKAAS